MIINKPQAFLESEIAKLENAVTQAWRIINVLNMEEMDRGESWPAANFWLRDWEHLRPKNKPDESITGGV